MRVGLDPRAVAIQRVDTPRVHKGGNVDHRAAPSFAVRSISLSVGVPPVGWRRSASFPVVRQDDHTSGGIVGAGRGDVAHHCGAVESRRAIVSGQARHSSRYRRPLSALGKVVVDGASPLAGCSPPVFPWLVGREWGSLAVLGVVKRTCCGG